MAGGVAILNAKTGGKKPTDLGKDGERQAGINPEEKQKIEVNNRSRVPDQLTKDELTEVKNVKKQANTRQLRDYSDFAKLTKRNKTLKVRKDTKISKPLQKAGWKIDRCLDIVQ